MDLGRSKLQVSIWYDPGRGFRVKRAMIAGKAPDARLVRQIVFMHSRSGTRALDAAFLGLYTEWFVRLDLPRKDANQLAAEALRRYQSPLKWALAPGAADMLDALEARRTTAYRDSSRPH